MQNNAVVFGPEAPPIYRVSGRDAVRYLHGRVTQDIKGLAEGRAARSLILTPQGRIQGHFVVLREATGFIIVSDSLPDEEAQTAFAKALMQFKVADDVVLEKTELRSLTIIGALAGAWPPAEPAENFAFYTENSLLILRRDRGAVIAHDVFGEPAAIEAFRSGLISAGAASGNDAAAAMIRIAAKLPQMGTELSEKILGPEVDIEQVASFQKGCYTGQEVVEMATARGRPNRMLSLFEGFGGDVPEPGAELFIPGGDKSVGMLTSLCALRGEGKVLALGFVKTAAAESPSFLAGGLELKRLS